MTLVDPLLLAGGTAAAALAAIVTLAVWLPRAGRATTTELLRGARNGTIVALVLLAAIAALVLVATVGRPFFFVTELSVWRALTLGLLVATPIAGGYLLAGLLVMLVGLLGRRGPRWATRDAWLATPIIAAVAVAAIGFASFMVRVGDEPVLRNGTVMLAVRGDRLGSVVVTGQARCTLFGSGLLRLESGLEVTPFPLTASDGRDVTVQFRLAPGDEPDLVLQVGDRGASAARGPAPTYKLATGSDSNSGSLAFSGLVPLATDTGEPSTTESWQGIIEWGCS